MATAAIKVRDMYATASEHEWVAAASISSLTGEYAYALIKNEYLEIRCFALVVFEREQEQPAAVGSLKSYPPTLENNAMQSFIVAVVNNS